MAEKAQLIGERIKTLRKQKGFSQAKLAVKVDKTAGAIGQYETGRNLPTIQVLERLAAEFAVSTEWLMTGEEPDEVIKAQTTTERDILKLIRSIGSEKHETILAMLRGISLEKKPDK